MKKYEYLIWLARNYRFDVSAGCALIQVLRAALIAFTRYSYPANLVGYFVFIYLFFGR